MRIAVIDMGGTRIKSGIWNGKNLGEIKEQDTNALKGGACVMENVLKILKTYLPFDAVGVSTAGQVDTSRGTIYYANENIPGYTGMEIKKKIQSEFGCLVEVENDVNAAALGEAYFGAGKGVKDFLCLTYGTGVGGAIVLDGRVYPRHTWSAGSFGGIVVHPEAMKEGEEFSGCYEKYASATALVKKAAETDPSLTDGRKIFEKIERPEVRDIVDNWIDEIVYGLLTLVHVFDPMKILLGGGILEQEYIICQVKKRMASRLSLGFRGVEIEKARLGNRAGLMGAAWMAEEALKKQ